MGIDLGSLGLPSRSAQVEDIVDTGTTAHHLLGALTEAGASSTALVALLDKSRRRTTEVEVLHSGFEVLNTCLKTCQSVPQHCLHCSIGVAGCKVQSLHISACQ